MNARQREKLRRQRERVEALKREDALAIAHAMLGVEARASVRMSHADDEPAGPIRKMSGVEIEARIDALVARGHPRLPR